MKPILFNTEMVRAILEGRKTVTRRVVKPQPMSAHEILGPSEEDDGTFEFFCGGFDGEKYSDWITAIKMPFQAGDILYVRETFFVSKGKYYYKADGKHLALNAIIGGKEFFKWRPSIHMPKEAARIFLRVMDVRVERLHDISDVGARKEGLGRLDVIYNLGALVCKFAELWDSTIKPADRTIYGWAANPWVWVIEFERISKEETIA